MRDYKVIERQVRVENGIAVNVTEFPQDASYDGQYIGVGSPKIHNLYKAAWNPKREQMTWSFVMLVGRTESAPVVSTHNPIEQNYEIIERKVRIENGVAVNVTEFPQDASYDGQHIGVGAPKLHNLYKAAWNPKREQMTWSFVMLVGAPKMKA